MGVYFFNRDKKELKEAKEILIKYDFVPQAKWLLGIIEKLEK